MITFPERKITTVMNDGGQHPLFSFESLLTGLSYGYGIGLAVREMGYRKGLLRQYRLPCKVISIGNLTTGGTGKTPMTIKTARMLQRMGFSVVVISRGYKGTAEKTGGMVSDGRRLLMHPDESGDEPYLIASVLEGVPVWVGADRFETGQKALSRFHPDVILLDDGFQHRRLARDVDLVLLDSERPFGNGHLLPRGTLRESISGLWRADAIILTRCEHHHRAWPDFMTGHADRDMRRRLRRRLQYVPQFNTRHVPHVAGVICGRRKNRAPVSLAGDANRSGKDALRSLIGLRLHGFSGIARNDDFRQTVESFQARPLTFQAFPDHHAYTDHDLQGILTAAQQNHADAIVTTEKDYVRIADRISWSLDLVVVGIEMALGAQEAALGRFLRGRLT